MTHPIAERLRERSQYNLCDGCGWVCENHPSLSWEPESDSPYACGCGAGMPCPGCKTCPSKKPIFTGSVTDRFVEPLKFARYYIVEALEVQENSDLRDALVTLDWLIDGDAA